MVSFFSDITKDHNLEGRGCGSEKHQALLGSMLPMHSLILCSIDVLFLILFLFPSYSPQKLKIIIARMIR